MASKRLTCYVCNGQGYYKIRNISPRFGDPEIVEKVDCKYCEGRGYFDFPETNGDRIRSMTNEQLAEFIYSLCPGNRFFCEICPHEQECMDICNSECKEIPDGWCKETFLAWMKTPRDEKTLPSSDDYYERQESGLLEEE